MAEQSPQASQPIKATSPDGSIKTQAQYISGKLRQEQNAQIMDPALKNRAKAREKIEKAQSRVKQAQKEYKDAQQERNALIKQRKKTTDPLEIEDLKVQIEAAKKRAKILRGEKRAAKKEDRVDILKASLDVRTFKERSIANTRLVLAIARVAADGMREPLAKLSRAKRVEELLQEREQGGVAGFVLRHVPEKFAHGLGALSKEQMRSATQHHGALEALANTKPEDAKKAGEAGYGEHIIDEIVAGSSLHEHIVNELLTGSIGNELQGLAQRFDSLSEDQQKIERAKLGRGLRKKLQDVAKKLPDDVIAQEFLGTNATKAERQATAEGIIDMSLRLGADNLQQMRDEAITLEKAHKGSGYFETQYNEWRSVGEFALKNVRTGLAIGAGLHLLTNPLTAAPTAGILAAGGMTFLTQRLKMQYDRGIALIDETRGIYNAPGEKEGAFALLEKVWGKDIDLTISDKEFKAKMNWLALKRGVAAAAMSFVFGAGGHQVLGSVGEAMHHQVSAHEGISAIANAKTTDVNSVVPQADGQTVQNAQGLDLHTNATTSGALPHNCFVAGTLILMADGTQKVIEAITVGEKVYSYNEWTQEIVVQVVEEIVRPIHKDMVVITFANGTKNTNTFDHPYFIKDKGWSSYQPALTHRNYGMDVGHLVVGDIAHVYKEGKLEEVEITSIHIILGKTQTYNLSQIADTHTYFANGILVHNKGLGAGTGFNPNNPNTVPVPTDNEIPKTTPENFINDLKKLVGQKFNEHDPNSGYPMNQDLSKMNQDIASLNNPKLSQDWATYVAHREAGTVTTDDINQLIRDANYIKLRPELVAIDNDINQMKDAMNNNDMVKFGQLLKDANDHINNLPPKDQVYFSGDVQKLASDGYTPTINDLDQLRENWDTFRANIIPDGLHGDSRAFGDSDYWMYKLGEDWNSSSESPLDKFRSAAADLGRVAWNRGEDLAAHAGEEFDYVVGNTIHDHIANGAGSSPSSSAAGAVPPPGGTQTTVDAIFNHHMPNVHESHTFLGNSHNPDHFKVVYDGDKTDKILGTWQGNHTAYAADGQSVQFYGTYPHSQEFIQMPDGHYYTFEPQTMHLGSTTEVTLTPLDGGPAIHNMTQDSFLHMVGYGDQQNIEAGNVVNQTYQEWAHAQNPPIIGTDNASDRLGQALDPKWLAKHPGFKDMLDRNLTAKGLSTTDIHVPTVRMGEATVNGTHINIIAQNGFVDTEHFQNSLTIGGGGEGSIQDWQTYGFFGEIARVAQQNPAIFAASILGGIILNGAVNGFRNIGTFNKGMRARNVAAEGVLVTAALFFPGVATGAALSYVGTGVARFTIAGVGGLIRYGTHSVFGGGGPSGGSPRPRGRGGRGRHDPGGGGGDDNSGGGSGYADPAFPSGQPSSSSAGASRGSGNPPGGSGQGQPPAPPGGAAASVVPSTSGVPSSSPVNQWVTPAGGQGLPISSDAMNALNATVANPKNARKAAKVINADSHQKRGAKINAKQIQGIVEARGRDWAKPVSGETNFERGNHIAEKLARTKDVENLDLTMPANAAVAAQILGVEGKDLADVARHIQRRAIVDHAKSSKVVGVRGVRSFNMINGNHLQRIRQEFARKVDGYPISSAQIAREQIKAIQQGQKGSISTQIERNKAVRDAYNNETDTATRAVIGTMTSGQSQPGQKVKDGLEWAGVAPKDKRKGLFRKEKTEPSDPKEIARIAKAIRDANILGLDPDASEQAIRESVYSLFGKLSNYNEYDAAVSAAFDQTQPNIPAVNADTHSDTEPNAQVVDPNAAEKLKTANLLIQAGEQRKNGNDQYQGGLAKSAFNTTVPTEITRDPEVLKAKRKFAEAVEGVSDDPALKAARQNMNDANPQDVEARQLEFERAVIKAHKNLPPEQRTQVDSAESELADAVVVAAEKLKAQLDQSAPAPKPVRKPPTQHPTPDEQGMDATGRIAFIDKVQRIVDSPLGLGSSDSDVRQKAMDDIAALYPTFEADLKAARADPNTATGDTMYQAYEIGDRLKKENPETIYKNFVVRLEGWRRFRARESMNPSEVRQFMRELGQAIDEVKSKQHPSLDMAENTSASDELQRAEDAFRQDINRKLQGSNLTIETNITLLQKLISARQVMGSDNNPIDQRYNFVRNTDDSGSSHLGILSGNNPNSEIAMVTTIRNDQHLSYSSNATNIDTDIAESLTFALDIRIRDSIEGLPGYTFEKYAIKDGNLYIHFKKTPNPGQPKPPVPPPAQSPAPGQPAANARQTVNKPPAKWPGGPNANNASQPGFFSRAVERGKRAAGGTRNFVEKRIEQGRDYFSQIREDQVANNLRKQEDDPNTPDVQGLPDTQLPVRDPKNVQRMDTTQLKAAVDNRIFPPTYNGGANYEVTRGNRQQLVDRINTEQRARGGVEITARQLQVLYDKAQIAQDIDNLTERAREFVREVYDPNNVRDALNLADPLLAEIATKFLTRKGEGTSQERLRRNVQRMAIAESVYYQQEPKLTLDAKLQKVYKGFKEVVDGNQFDPSQVLDQVSAFGEILLDSMDAEEFDSKVKQLYRDQGVQVRVLAGAFCSDKRKVGRERIREGLEFGGLLNPNANVSDVADAAEALSNNFYSPDYDTDAKRNELYQIFELFYSNNEPVKNAVAQRLGILAPDTGAQPSSTEAKSGQELVTAQQKFIEHIRPELKNSLTVKIYQSDLTALIQSGQIPKLPAGTDCRITTEGMITADKRKVRYLSIRANGTEAGRLGITTYGQKLIASTQRNVAIVEAVVLALDQRIQDALRQIPDYLFDRYDINPDDGQLYIKFQQKSASPPPRKPGGPPNNPPNKSPTANVEHVQPLSVEDQKSIAEQLTIQLKGIITSNENGYRPNTGSHFYTNDQFIDVVITNLYSTFEKAYDQLPQNADADTDTKKAFLAAYDGYVPTNSGVENWQFIMNKHDIFAKWVARNVERVFPLSDSYGFAVRDQFTRLQSRIVHELEERAEVSSQQRVVNQLPTTPPEARQNLSENPGRQQVAAKVLEAIQRGGDQVEVILVGATDPTGEDNSSDLTMLFRDGAIDGKIGDMQVDDKKLYVDLRGNPTINVHDGRGNLPIKHFKIVGGKITAVSNNNPHFPDLEAFMHQRADAIDQSIKSTIPQDKWEFKGYEWVEGGIKLKLARKQGGSTSNSPASPSLATSSPRGQASGEAGTSSEPIPDAQAQERGERSQRANALIQLGKGLGRLRLNDRPSVEDVKKANNSIVSGYKKFREDFVAAIDTGDIQRIDDMCKQYDIAPLALRGLALESITPEQLPVLYARHLGTQAYLRLEKINERISTDEAVYIMNHVMRVLNSSLQNSQSAASQPPQSTPTSLTVPGSRSVAGEDESGIDDTVDAPDWTEEDILSEVEKRARREQWMKVIEDHAKGLNVGLDNNDALEIFELYPHFKQDFDHARDKGRDAFNELIKAYGGVALRNDFPEAEIKELHAHERYRKLVVDARNKIDGLDINSPIEKKIRNNFREELEKLDKQLSENSGGSSTPPSGTPTTYTGSTAASQPLPPIMPTSAAMFPAQIVRADATMPAVEDMDTAVLRETHLPSSHDRLEFLADAMQSYVDRFHEYQKHLNPNADPIRRKMIFTKLVLQSEFLATRPNIETPGLSEAQKAFVDAMRDLIGGSIEDMSRVMDDHPEWVRDATVMNAANTLVTQTYRRLEDLLQTIGHVDRTVTDAQTTEMQNPSDVLASQLEPDEQGRIQINPRRLIEAMRGLRDQTHEPTEKDIRNANRAREELYLIFSADMLNYFHLNPQLVDTDLDSAIRSFTEVMIQRSDVRTQKQAFRKVRRAVGEIRKWKPGVPKRNILGVFKNAYNAVWVVPVANILDSSINTLHAPTTKYFRHLDTYTLDQEWRSVNTDTAPQEPLSTQEQSASDQFRELTSEMDEQDKMNALRELMHFSTHAEELLTATQGDYIYNRTIDIVRSSLLINPPKVFDYLYSSQLDEARNAVSVAIVNYLMRQEHNENGEFTSSYAAYRNTPDDGNTDKALIAFNKAKKKHPKWDSDPTYREKANALLALELQIAEEILTANAPLVDQLDSSINSKTLKVPGEKSGADRQAVIERVARLQAAHPDLMKPYLDALKRDEDLAYVYKTRGTLQIGPDAFHDAIRAQINTFDSKGKLIGYPRIPVQGRSIRNMGRFLSEIEGSNSSEITDLQDAYLYRFYNVLRRYASSDQSIDEESLALIPLEVFAPDPELFMAFIRERYGLKNRLLDVKMTDKIEEARVAIVELEAEGDQDSIILFEKSIGKKIQDSQKALQSA